MTVPNTPQAYRRPGKKLLGETRKAQLASVARRNPESIKNIAKRRGLSTTGKTDEVIARIEKDEAEKRPDEIAARRAELEAYDVDLLKRFAVKRHVTPVGSPSEIIDAILAVEYE